MRQAVPEIVIVLYKPPAGGYNVFNIFFILE